MRLMRSLNLRTTVDREWLLAKLKENRDEHTEMFREAQAGYISTALARLKRASERLSAGEAVELNFRLTVPTDHTAEYTTVIGMIENHTEPKIELSADEYRMFVEDQWDWSENWFASNRGYSETVAAKATEWGI